MAEHLALGFVCVGSCCAWRKQDFAYKNPIFFHHPFEVYRKSPAHYLTARGSLSLFVSVSPPYVLIDSIWTPHATHLQTRTSYTFSTCTVQPSDYPLIKEAIMFE